MAAKYGEVVEKVLGALKDFGPMTARELSTDLNIPVNVVSVALHRCRKVRIDRHSKFAKRVYIESWTRTLVIERLRVRDNPRMVFALGSKPDAKKPPPQSNAERNRKKRNKKAVRVNSIFAVGAINMNRMRNNAP